MSTEEMDRLHALKLPQLRARAKELKLPNVSKLPKAELVKKILAHSPPSPDRSHLLPASRKTTEEAHGSSKVRIIDRVIPNPILPTVASNVVALNPPLASTSEADKSGSKVKPSTKPDSASNHGSMRKSTTQHPFQPPRPLPVKPAPTPPLMLARLSEPSPALGPIGPRRSDRVSYLQSHWLSTLFKNLNDHRGQPHPSTPPPFAGLNDELLSASPDQFDAAIRFWIARLHTNLQLGNGEAWSVHGRGLGMVGPDFTTWPPVTACSRYAGDIYQITAGKTYLCISSTGEVIGSDTLRFDWQQYTLSPLPLSALVKTKDKTNFPGGISKKWAERATTDELAVATRAVLSSCMLNSFSGEQRSAVQMDSEWLGRPHSSHSGLTVELYLPETHQVQSLPVAFVHRSSGDTDIVLCEIGQIIGSEDGIAELWQGILGCDGNGRAKDVREFWRGWEDRL